MEDYEEFNGLEDIFGADEDYSTPSMEDELRDRGMTLRDFL